MNTKEGSPCVVTVTDMTPFLAKHADKDYDNAIHYLIMFYMAQQSLRYEA